MLPLFRIQMNRADNRPHSLFRLLRRFWILLTFLSLFAACEVDMTVAVDTKTPPTFSLSGSGDLLFFTVKELAPENQRLYPAQRDSNRDSVLWQIWPNNVPSTRVWRLPSITYGIPPAGFIQKIPEHGQPPPLVDGKVYEAGGPNSNANGGFVWFTIRNGEVIRVAEP
ncbi:MAG: hypothetical protein ND895_28115 [Pyrinomonadaceae bacterium]|nr:hypothetical protein [Pyrinomonadaceae bacterium]